MHKFVLFRGFGSLRQHQGVVQGLSELLLKGRFWGADEFNPQEVRARAEARANQACSLYVSLVPCTTGMLQGLLESYARADPVSRKVLEQLGDSLARALTSTNPELQAAVVDHPAGSGPLLLSMLVKLTGIDLILHSVAWPSAVGCVTCKDAVSFGQCWFAIVRQC